MEISQAEARRRVFMKRAVGKGRLYYRASINELPTEELEVLYSDETGLWCQPLSFFTNQIEAERLEKNRRLL